ncbi:hypothetical protein NQZ68_012098 [Dissostichus eleginoides]|nr:hypothetical protein NQZ68_012098 [Dissostichus eleginoides]
MFCTQRERKAIRCIRHRRGPLAGAETGNICCSRWALVGHEDRGFDQRPSQTPSYKSSDETASQTHTKNNRTYPHFQRTLAKQLPEQRARCHLLDRQSRCCTSSTCDGKMIHSPARLHRGMVCTRAYSLPAQTDTGGGGHHHQPLYRTVTCSCS